jgi:dihydropteroate synthase
MGIVNVTPDSFFDGGRHQTVDAARAHCERLVEEGADILDIGGESTRPGARATGVQEELDRVLPVLGHACTLGVPVSVDTSRAEVMRAALAAGADIVNDVRALRWPGALDVVAAHAGCGVCLMHMLGDDPAAMQQAPTYDDVVNAVRDFLHERLVSAMRAGVAKTRIVLDPGIGFGKMPEHNWALMQGLDSLLAIGQPLLVGWSRKSTLGALTGRAADDRLAASLAAALAAVQRGARIVRVHDVAATVDALAAWRRCGLIA